MSSSSRMFRAAALAAMLACASALAGCSGFRPVYGESALGTERHEMRYGKPESRLDQIIYQELVLRLGRTASPDAPLLTVTTTSATRALTRTRVGADAPQEQREASVTATILLTDAGGKTVFTARRSAAAQYTIDDQVLAAVEAEREAKERAAKALAETVRLAILGALAGAAD